MKRLGKIVLILIALFLLCCAGLEAFILLSARDDVRHEPKVMIVLGAMVWPDGPSPVLRYRLDKALEYLDDHPEMTVIVSGGQGNDEPCSEAQAMADALIAAGVPAEQIVLEDTSFNTRQNLQNSRALMAELGYDPENTPVL
ncbi:MAG: YdcF family protein, partial [Oscillospiraceae bacterium]|nr:YdcF family protein [Oscillospiraceae bacterium]